MFDAMEVWGIENAEEWSSGALMRYRSRRVMMDMVTDPVFDQFHDAKFTAIEKTIAYPVTTVVSTGSLALTVGLSLFSLALGMHLISINRQKVKVVNKKRVILIAVFVFIALAASGVKGNNKESGFGWTHQITIAHSMQEKRGYYG